MKRRSSLRAPLVITVAATTAMGCGASVTSNASDAGDASVTTDTHASTDRETPTDQPIVVETDVRRACPSALPSDGSSCTPGVDPETCTDPSMTPDGCPPGTGTTVRCDPSTQRWQRLQISCNPPPLVQCPTERPGDGSACPVGTYSSSPLRCQYDLCGARYATVATCSGSTARWSVQQSSCNPPAPICPIETPAPGSTCGVPSALSCQWGDCAGRSAARGTCVDSRWVIDIAECSVDAGAPPTDS